MTMTDEPQELSQAARQAFAARWTRAVLDAGQCPICQAPLRADAMAGWYRCSVRGCLFLMYVGGTSRPANPSL